MIEVAGDGIEVALDVAKWTRVMNGEWEIQPAQQMVSQHPSSFKGAITM